MLFNSNSFQLDLNPLSETLVSSHTTVLGIQYTVAQKMMIRSQILGLIYAITGSQQARPFQSVDRCQNVRSMSIQSDKWEHISGLRVHIHQLHAPDKDSALL